MRKRLPFRTASSNVDLLTGLLDPVENIEINLSILDLFHRDSRWFVLPRIDVDSRDRTTLKLLASLRREDYHSILRIDLRRIDDLFNFVFCLVNFYCRLLVSHIYRSVLRILKFSPLETTKNTLNNFTLSMRALSFGQDYRSQFVRSGCYFVIYDHVGET